MKNSFVLYTEYAKHLSLLSMEQRGVLFTAIMAYETGEDLPEMDGMTQMAFSFISEQLSRDKDKYETTCKRRSEAGRQGGRPKESESEEKQELSEESEEKQELSEESKKSKCFSEKANENNGKQTKAKKTDNEDEDEYEYVDEHEDEREVEIEGEYERGKEISLPPLSPLKPPQDDINEGLAVFLRTFPNVVVDNCAVSSLDLDYEALSREFAQSSWLRKKEHDLSWVAYNAAKIIRGRYRDRREEGTNDDVYQSLWEKYDREEKLNHG